MHENMYYYRASHLTYFSQLKMKAIFASTDSPLTILWSQDPMPRYHRGNWSICFLTAHSASTKKKKNRGVEQSGYISTVNGDPERLETADLDFQKKKELNWEDILSPSEHRHSRLHYKMTSEVIFILTFLQEIILARKHKNTCKEEKQEYRRNRKKREMLLFSLRSPKPYMCKNKLINKHPAISFFAII